MMQIIFNDNFTLLVDEASESYINHTRQFWCKSNTAASIDIDALREQYITAIPTEEVTSIKIYNDVELLFELTGIYNNLEINKFYQSDGTCFLTLTLRKQFVLPSNDRSNSIQEESEE